MLDQLPVSGCPVLCWSGGGPYALAMAHRYPEIINSVFILCGISRQFNKEVFRQMGLNKWYFRLAKNIAWLLRAGMNVLRKREVKKVVPQKFTGLAYVDYALLKEPSHLQAVANNTMKEACRNGARGAVYEAQSYCKDFGFQLSEVKQPVHYWWGTLDMSVDQLHAEAVEHLVPNAVMHYRQNEGHLSMYIKGFVEAVEIINNR
jgi:pimeloyl-ACP methyl ester carboxylesterase